MDVVCMVVWWMAGSGCGVCGSVVDVVWCVW